MPLIILFTCFCVASVNAFNDVIHLFLSGVCTECLYLLYVKYGYLITCLIVFFNLKAYYAIIEGFIFGRFGDSLQERFTDVSVLGGVSVPCIHRMPGGVILGDSGSLLLCLRSM